MMDMNPLAALVQNAALLLALAVVYEVLGFTRQEGRRPGRQVATGLLLGLLGITVMLSAWTMAPGLIFDTRSVMLGIAGLFFGTVPALTAAALTGGFRLWVGGPGTLMGVTVVLVSAGIGLAWRNLRRNKVEHIRLGELYLFGFVVHLAMLAAMALLPGGYAFTTFALLAGPIMLVYPLATALVGWLLASRHERLRAEAELRANEARYRRFFETQPLPVLVVDLEDLQVRLVNQAAVDSTGYSRDELLGLRLPDLVPPKHHEALDARLREIRQEPDAYRPARIWQHQRKDGSIIEVEVASHLTSFEGRRVLVMTAQDLTEKNLLGEQVRQAQKMEAVGRLAGAVAHDFNNVLQALSGQVQLAQDALAAAPGSGPEKVSHHLREISAQVRRAASLPRQLLFFARRETVKPEVLDLVVILDEASEMLRRLVREDITLEIRGSASTLPVEIDRGYIEQVLMNLVVNAVDAMPSGGRLEITAGSAGPMIWLTVADTGHGMTTEVRERLFEPFFTTKDAGRGTGLGLTVVRDIVTSAGGAIQVDSNEGEGAKFSVGFPLAAAERRKETSGARPVVPPQGKGERVLLVEDDPAARDSLTQILRSLNYRVTATASGEEAMQAAREAAFDVLVTDLVLPGMGGMDLALELTIRWPDVKVILVSGYTSDEVVRMGVPSGMIRFLQKPFDSVTLAVELRQVIEDPAFPRTSL